MINVEAKGNMLRVKHADLFGETEIVLHDFEAQEMIDKLKDGLEEMKQKEENQ